MHKNRQAGPGTTSQIIQWLRQGAALKARKDMGFYVVYRGRTIPVCQAEARRMLKAQRIRPEGVNRWGVMSFAWAADRAEAQL